MTQIGISIGVAQRSSIRTETAATAAFAAAVAAVTSALTTQRRATYDSLIGGSQDDGTWPIIERLAVLAGPGTDSASNKLASAIDLKDPTKSGIYQGTTTGVPDRGFTGDGTTGYFDFGAVGGAGGIYTQNSASFGVWCNLRGTTFTEPHMGTVTGVRAGIINVRTSAGNENFYVNDGTGDVFQANTASKVGHRSAGRTASNSKRGFMNGARVADLTTASVGLPTSNFTVGRHLGSYTQDRFSAAWFGGGMTDAQHAMIHARLSTFLTSIGAA